MKSLFRTAIMVFITLTGCVDNRSANPSTEIYPPSPVHSVPRLPESIAINPPPVVVSSIQELTTWRAVNDPATNGSSSGTMSLSGSVRKFVSSFTNSGGELYHVTFGVDPKSLHFSYDAWVYFDDSASTIANLEMDMNQVIDNGQTVIYGFQCDGYSGTWDYTENSGTPATYIDRWVHSTAPCNPRNWTRNVWHHILITYSRDAVGNVTYHSVSLDDVVYAINATVPSSFALGWGSVLLTNFQIDGLGSGSNTVYLDKLTISRW